MHKKQPIDVACLVSHPIQYQVPLFQNLSDQSDINLHVYFCDDHGVNDSFDKQFNREISWDIPLLKGYESTFLSNISPKPNQSSVAGMVNPSIAWHIVRQNTDVLWVHGWEGITHWLSFAVARFSKTPIIIRGDSTLASTQRLPQMLKKTRELVLRTLFSNINAFAVTGTPNREFYNSFGISENLLFDAPLTVDNSWFQKRHPDRVLQAETREKIGIPPSDIVILQVGKLINRKRADLLIRLVKKIDKQNVSLLLVGDGPQKENYERLASELGVSDSVYFTGFVEQSELPKMYGISDIFVLASNYEPWGLVINEAMNFSLPIVASDTVGASQDLIKENGAVFKSGSVRSLQNQIEPFVSDDKLRLSAGIESKKLINDWSIDSTARGIIAAAKYCLN
ncbi:glycosyltransferase [Salinigranum halophilum]|uniref:glycosyltransferase n=1 Tax=Salinigranum halophilum TaxID=2565931 RepID=UPI00115E4D18|nr:glycosyltransferase [Salinigranum halophilum]